MQANTVEQQEYINDNSISTQVFGRYIRLGDLEVDSICFTPRDHFALKIIKQDNLKHETTIQVLDKLDKDIDYIYSRSCEELVIVLENGDYLDEMLGAHAIAVANRNIEVVNQTETAKQVKNKIDFNKIPEVKEYNVDKAVEEFVKSDVGVAVAEEAIAEDEAGLTMEFPTQEMLTEASSVNVDAEEAVEPLVEAIPIIEEPTIAFTGVIGIDEDDEDYSISYTSTTVENSVVADKPKKTRKPRTPKAKIDKPIDIIEESPIINLEAVDAEIMDLVFNFVFMGEKKLGEVVNFLSTKTDLKKPELAAKVRKLCSLTGSTIKRNGERISVI